MPFARVSFINGGHCTQLGWFAGRRDRGPGRFDDVFILLEHATHGIHLIDTGYSPYFFEATRGLPQRLYRWTTPVKLDGDAASILASRGVRPDDMQSIFISHFHGDHVAGLRHFDRARFVYRREAHQSLMSQGALRQVCHGFLPQLLPDDFVARGAAVEESAFTGSFGDFRAYDYWGDGDLLLVDLPGHAPGHMGFAFRTAGEQFFYIADACWDMEAMLSGRSLPAPSRWLQHSAKVYEETQEKLRRFAQRDDWRMLACHCPRTQDHVDAPH